MSSSSKRWFVLLILLLASLTHWLKLAVLSHYYLHMMKSCHDPPVSHLWDRSTCRRLLDLIKLFSTTQYASLYLMPLWCVPRKKYWWNLVFQKCLLFNSYVPYCFVCEKTFLHSKPEDNHCAVALFHVRKYWPHITTHPSL